MAGLDAKPTPVADFAEPLPDEDTEVLHPWVRKARAIDQAVGGADLDPATLARYVRILRAATSGTKRGARRRRLAGPSAGRA
jgi:hypothetical protein